MAVGLGGLVLGLEKKSVEESEYILVRVLRFLDVCDYCISWIGSIKAYIWSCMVDMFV